MRFRFRRIELAADKSLDRIDSIRRVGDGLALGDLPDQPLALVGEADDAGRRAAAFFVRDDLHRAAFQNGDAAVGRSQIDSDYFSHKEKGLAVFVCGDFDHCRSKQAIADAITTSEFFNHCVRFVFIGRFSHDCFVHVRIEALADRGDRFDTEGFQDVRKLLADQLNAVQKMTKLSRFTGLDGTFGIQRA